MKKIFLLLVVLFSCAPLMSAQTGGGDDPIIIFVGSGGNEGGASGIHAPIQIPIQAAYYSSLSTIMVNFLYDLGSVSVETENETTGEYAQTIINATQGFHPFLISGTEGHWSITFTLSNGVVYFGEFNIYS